MSDIFKLYQLVFDSRKHLLEMIEDRGYDVSHLKDYNSDDIKTMLIEHKTGKFVSLPDIGPLDILLEKNVGTPNSEKIYIKYRLDHKFKKTAGLIAQITDIYDKHLSTKDTLIILNIYRVLIKPGVKDKTDEEFGNTMFITNNYFVQLFGLENFLMNVSKHQFVPKHRLLSKIEMQELLAKFNCNGKNIPTIKRDDAQAKYIGLRPKQICEIIAQNVSSGNIERYRLCVSN